MLLLHYAYYAMLRYDRLQGFWRADLSRKKAMFVFFVLETWLLGIAYVWCVGIPLKIVHIPTPWYSMAAYVIASLYLISRLFATERVIRYEKIFDEWNDRKRRKWNLAWIAASILCFAAFMTSVVALHHLAA